MIKINNTQQEFGKVEAQSRIVFVIDKNLEALDDKVILEELDFKEISFVQSSRTLYVNLDKLTAEHLAEASAKAIRAMRGMKYENVKVQMLGGAKEHYATILGILCGFYQFLQYKSQKQTITLHEVLVCGVDEEVVQKALILAESINLVRDLVNTIPNDATPAYLAQIAQEESQKVGLTCKVLDTQAIKAEKMEALLAVSRASAHEPKVIHLTYKHPNAQKRLVFVGKGLTYDSGGLSLKPADYMVTMKADKSGGCAVLGILSAIARLGLPLEVHGIIGAVENMIGGNAYKPDDVLFSREGKSIEVRNTDAEGRLVLADCLSYAQDLNPDYLIDLATLTGACVVGLGEYTTGIMGYNKELKAQMEECASRSGELANQLHFNHHLKGLIDSKIADICNVSSSRYGGAITAGMFLGAFIREKYQDVWLHLDIAGPAFVEKEWGINPYGASGAGVRACVEFAIKQGE
ncbi:leucyl aminopeptidase [Helicobacter enhydrae]|uniref:Probable cytosol aminopeptidase n=1 Tax=Helicobacter enhydrae TaxID=222136 RepID=A0A1B1U3V7_9HELI|nr:leucyl aminopeptidase [Helicobacter enhydrae]ANV97443.1 leucyl aminopeptidase [Helicobacter enhydrae]